MDWKQELFFKLPMWMKELAAATEAVRRNHYRRYGNYQQILDEFSFQRLQKMSADQVKQYQIDKFNKLFADARQNSQFYKSRLPTTPIKSFDDLLTIPILQKADVRDHLDEMISTTYDRKNFYWGQTSGSTGTPLKIGIARELVRVRFAIEDNYSAYWGTPFKEKRARFSAVMVATIDQEKPPFWVLNRVYNQLQMSAYHITNQTAPYYIERLREFKPLSLSGFPHAIYLLASYLLEHGEKFDGVKAVYSDSENLFPEHRQAIEEAFQTKVHDRYGCVELTGGAYGCSQNRFAETSLSCKFEVLDENDRPVKPGEIGRVIFTDLLSQPCPYIRYDTGDLAVYETNCSCEFGHLFHIDNIAGRVDDMVITPKGRWVGRLSQVPKAGVGIRESQIIQHEIDHIEVLIVPTENFEPDSMKRVEMKAKDLLGSDMKVSWRVVEKIPPSPNSHKFKQVIRNPKLGKPKLG